MLLKYKDFKELNTQQMKKIFGGAIYSCSVTKKAGAPAFCNNYSTSFNCNIGSLSSCCGAADSLANSDSTCFVQGSGNCYAQR